MTEETYATNTSRNGADGSSEQQDGAQLHSSDITKRELG